MKLSLAFLVLIYTSFAAANTCQIKIQNESLDNEITVPQSLMESSKVVYDNQYLHPLEKEEYLKKLKIGEIVVLTSRWDNASGAEYGKDLLIVDSKTCKVIKAVTIYSY